MPEPDQVPRQLRAIYDLLSVEENAALAGGNPEKIIQWLYRILDIIDSKTSHLLQLNAIVLAVQTFLVNGILAARSVSRLTLFASVLFLLVPFLGTMACMWVFRIAWPFLDWQKAGSLAITDRTTVEQQMRREFVELAKVCDRRTRFHGWVWWSTLASIVLLPLSVWIRFRSFF